MHSKSFVSNFWGALQNTERPGGFFIKSLTYLIICKPRLLQLRYPEEPYLL